MLELRCVNVCIRRGGRLRWVKVFAHVIGNLATFPINGLMVMAWS
jgi:hypothetical protein